MQWILLINTLQFFLKTQLVIHFTTMTKVIILELSEFYSVVHIVLIPHNSIFTWMAASCLKVFITNRIFLPFTNLFW